MKKAGFDVAASGKVRALNPEESRKLLASQSKRRQLSVSSSSIHRNSPEEKKELTNALRANTHKPTQQRDARRSNQGGLIPVMQRNRMTKVLSPREKVLKTLSLFKVVYEALDREKAVQPGESKTAMARLNHETRRVLIENGKQVNADNIIGAVPGIEVGDEFQFKAELNLIVLHFDMMGGIDWMYKDGMLLATSVVSSEGAGYDDQFNSNTIIYCGCVSKSIEDPMSKKSNLAMINSMRKNSPIRVIRGQKKTVNRYVYKGLYLVNDYWQEKLPSGYICFKFKLLPN